MEHLKELVSPKTLHWPSYVANLSWIVLGVIFFGIFADMESYESRFDFRCGSNKDKELIRGKCYEQYEKQYHKMPVYWFVIINFFVTSSVAVIYSQVVKSRVNELEAHIKDEEQQAEQRIRNPTRKKLFKAYCFQLAARFLLGIFFVVIQANLLYPDNFPSNFNCNLKDNSTNITTSNVKQTQTSYECHNQRAAKKTFGCHFLIGVTGFFALLAFVEATFILFKFVRSIRREERFMEDPQFYKYYLKSNSNASLLEPEQQELYRTNNHEHQHQPSTSIVIHIERMKKYVQTVTDRPLSDLKSPFHRNPGEGFGTDITLDQIYTNLNIHEGRVDLEHLAGDRDTLLENYPPKIANLRSRPADIFDANKQNILLVGHPGTGKTMLCTKILRDWASDKLFVEGQNKQLDFQVAFLVKLRMLNCLADQELNLRELLEYSEYSATLSDENEVWDYIRQNPNKVLVIFDGFDEYSSRTKIDNKDILCKNPEEDTMPLHSLLKMILSGKILAGATVLTTTRPTAVSCFGSLCFDRTVEILGFTTDQVEEYVEKFTNGGDKAETIKEHIRSNLILRSFCYIPVNCFIICSCLLKLLIDNSADQLGCLPTKLTEIYSVAIKIFYFCYDDDRYRHHKDRGRDFYLKPFKELPEAVTRVFSRLGEIAFSGIQQGRLVFESQEVSDLETNGLFQRLPDTSSGLKEGKAQYCFLHLTVQEFFAAKHLVDTMSHEELKTFVSDHIKEGAWKVVMQFVAGLLEQKEQSTDIFSGLLPLSSVTRETTSFEISREITREEFEARTETVTCWPAKGDRELTVTLFNCMYENNSSGLKVQRRLAQTDCNALDFSDCRLSPLDCLTLVHALQSSGEKIVYFNLASNNIADLGCIEISKFFGGKDHNQGFCNLQFLNLNNNRITDEGVEYLTTALINNNCKLNNLDLAFNKITDKGVEHLTKALINTNCKLNSLGLEGNKISDKGAEHLATALINTNCKLNSLGLVGNKITDKGVEHLTKALINVNCKLNSLGLGIFGRRTDKGVKYLTTALTHTNCKLTSLSLRSIYATDQFIEHLATALINNNCKLNLSLLLDSELGHITDKGVEHLTKVLTSSHCKLKRLNLHTHAHRVSEKNIILINDIAKDKNCEVGLFWNSSSDRYIPNEEFP